MNHVNPANPANPMARAGQTNHVNRELLHRRINDCRDQVQAWYRSKNQNLGFPIYSSFDLRDAGFKLGPVDANIFPAGFNNLCELDQKNSVALVKTFLDSHYSVATRKILLLTEEHTQNLYYWNNVAVLKAIIEGAGREVRLAMPKPMPSPLSITSASGAKLSVHTAARVGKTIEIDGFSPDLIISNNDFSAEYENWARDLETPVNPPRELGWYRRRKDRFFRVYNQLAADLCELLDLDPWLIQVETEVVADFDVDDEASRDRLAERAQVLYDRVKANYRNHGLDREPFLFVKNNAGTYGLGVTQIRHPDEIKEWNYKTRKKMKAAKGGREVTEVIIQEGIPTSVQGEGGVTAEPVIYMIGCQLAGGFLRAHMDKSDDENLNAPGAVFQRLCIADLDTKPEGCPMENVYGTIARLSFLSVAIEARELDVHFKHYNPTGPCS